MRCATFPPHVGAQARRFRDTRAQCTATVDRARTTGDTFVTTCDRVRQCERTQHARPRSRTATQKRRHAHTFPHRDAPLRTPSHMRAQSANARHMKPRRNTATHVSRNSAPKRTCSHHAPHENTVCVLSSLAHHARHARTRGDAVNTARMFGDSDRPLPTRAHSAARCRRLAHLAHLARRVRSVGACRNLPVGACSQKRSQPCGIMAFFRKREKRPKVRGNFAAFLGAFSRQETACEVFATQYAAPRKRDRVMQSRYHAPK